MSANRHDHIISHRIALHEIYLDNQKNESLDWCLRDFSSKDKGEGEEIPPDNPSRYNKQMPTIHYSTRSHHHDHQAKSGKSKKDTNQEPIGLEVEQR